MHCFRDLSNRVLPIIVSVIGFVVSHSETVGQENPPITDIAFSPDGKSVVACSQTGLEIFAWPSLKSTKKVSLSIANLHCVRFAPNGKRFAVGGGNPSEEGIVEIYSWPECKLLKTLADHDDSVRSMVFDGNDKLITASMDRTVAVWDIESEKVTRTLKGHSRSVNAVQILKGGEIVTAGDDLSLRVWSRESEKPRRNLRQHTKPVLKLSLRPESEGLNVLASAGRDRTIRFWQPKIGRMMRFIRLDSEPLDIIWLDKNRVAVSCVDGKVRFVNFEDVELLGEMEGLGEWAYAIAMSPGGDALVVGGAQGNLRRLDLRSLRK